METKDNRELLMGYLYGEMSTDEKKKFEDILTTHPDLREELDTFKNIRTNISIKDEEVVDPFMYAGSRSVSLGSTARIVSKVILRPAIGLAASISLFLLIGYFTGLKISTEKGYLSVSFGQSVQDEDYVSPDRFEKLEKEFTNYRSSMGNQFTDFRETVEVKFASLPEEEFTNQKENEIYNRITSQNSEQLYSLVSRLQKDNLRFMEQYFQTSNANQGQMIESMLVDFSVFLREQREEDLRKIQLSLSVLKNDQEIQILETKEVLASIINTVNSQNN